MLCPLCQETLQMTERKGVEIDYCPKCRGVWLDRGELQKIIELSMLDASPKPAPNLPTPPGFQNATSFPNAQSSFEAEHLEIPTREYREPPRAPRGDYGREAYRDDRNDYRPPPSRDDAYRNDSYSHKPKKRESWLSELFDWD